MMEDMPVRLSTESTVQIVATDASADVRSRVRSSIAMRAGRWRFQKIMNDSFLVFVFIREMDG